MKNNFTTSINIERDLDKSFNYIPTANAKKILFQIDQDFGSGIHSFSIIGSFGTGKSSFLLAFEKYLKGEKNVFQGELSNLKKNKYEFINIVSSYASINDNFNEKFKNNNNETVITSLETTYRKAKRKGHGLIIIIDEFGKILEHAIENNPEKEFYEIQKLSEYINDENKDILLIISLHQSFGNYLKTSNRVKINEWIKVSGRFKEITFNEPVEQLLFLAAEIIDNGKKNVEGLNNLIHIIKDSNTFPFEKLDYKIAKKLYPIDILAAALLTKALQKYGQNERSLFTFLNSNENIGLNKSDLPYFNTANVFDYLKYNFFNFLHSRYNPDFIYWQSIDNAFQRVETLFDFELNEAKTIVKTIGMVNILGSKGAKINKDFLEKYLNLTHQIKNTKNILAKLEKHKVIRFLGYKNTYVLFEGTDLDIEYELQLAGNRIDVGDNVVNYLKKYFSLTPVSAKAYYFKYGTPRYFEFVLSDKPIEEFPEGEIDGFINLILNNKIEVKDVKQYSKKSKDAIFFGLVLEPTKIIEHIKEIEKVNYLLGKIDEDRVAIRELRNLRNYHVEKINLFFEEKLFKDQNFVNWFYNGKLVTIESKSDFNKFLSQICEDVYSKTPILRNELINRHYLPGTISSARRRLLKHLFENWEIEDLNFEMKKYPPEKTIYLSLLKNTGIHKKTNNGFVLDMPDDKSYQYLWNTCARFLFDTTESKRSLNDLIEQLLKKPLKLKKGVIDFWLPIWLFINRNDYALFKQDMFIPNLSVETIDLILKKPGDYFIKKFELGGIKRELFNKYRDLINKDKKTSITKLSFIETIKPFLVFYQSLPAYTKRTNRLGNNAIRIREVIVNAKDPEKIFFEDFPNALGYTTNELNNSTLIIEKFIGDLKKSIIELQNAFTNLIERIENAIKEEFGYNQLEFPDYKIALQNRYLEVKKYALLPGQKIILQRINSKLDERNSWINSLVQSMINKQLENISDEEEEIIYDKLRSLKLEFDNLCEFANLNFNNKYEEAVKLQITTTTDGLVNKLIRLPKNINGKFHVIENKLRKELSDNINKNERIYILLKLLKEELNEK